MRPSPGGCLGTRPEEAAGAPATRWRCCPELVRASCVLAHPAGDSGPRVRTSCSEPTCRGLARSLRLRQLRPARGSPVPMWLVGVGCGRSGSGTGLCLWSLTSGGPGTWTGARSLEQLWSEWQGQEKMLEGTRADGQRSCTGCGGHTQGHAHGRTATQCTHVHMHVLTGAAGRAWPGVPAVWTGPDCGATGEGWGRGRAPGLCVWGLVSWGGGGLLAVLPPNALVTWSPPWRSTC